MSEFLDQTPEIKLAQNIIEQATTALEKERRIDITQRYSKILPNDFALNLRLSGSTGAVQGYRPDTRVISLTNNPTMHSSMVDTYFSLELNSLKNDDSELRGKSDDLFHVALATYNLDDQYGEQKQLLDDLIVAVMLHHTSGNCSPDAQYSLERSFLSLLDQGATKIVKNRTYQLSDTTFLWLRSTKLCGSNEHWPPSELDTTRLSIGVTETEKDRQTILDQNHDGSLECFSQQADAAARIAGYADPDNVHYDEDGNIFGVFASHVDEQAIKEAERAAGIRLLDLTQLQFLQAHLEAATS